MKLLHLNRTGNAQQLGLALLPQMPVIPVEMRMQLWKNRRKRLPQFHLRQAAVGPVAFVVADVDVLKGAGTAEHYLLLHHHFCFLQYCAL
jgi:hypothetical protein